jgi:hypothetical protein
MNAVKENGLFRLEGKEYVVKDGDIVHFALMLKTNGRFSSQINSENAFIIPGVEILPFFYGYPCVHFVSDTYII